MLKLLFLITSSIFIKIFTILQVLVHCNYLFALLQTRKSEEYQRSKIIFERVKIVLAIYTKNFYIYYSYFGDSEEFSAREANFVKVHLPHESLQLKVETVKNKFLSISARNNISRTRF